ncbi:MAG: hypothetical protein K2I37_06725 [Muribaculaceae bacterium]|nr:hypothetical protein [Muribaculaceae bacterium]MDE7343878.1 hypothetical protein [Muribaculaceae bacterium]
MKSIGGYPELELRPGEHYHSKALRLNTARNAFEYILRSRGYSLVYIPYYTCEAVTEPLRKLGIPWKFYHINDRFELANRITLGQSEALLYTNYFGIKEEYCRALAQKYGQSLILDYSQAFFDMPQDGIDTFYSPRKFIGVSDGAYLYTSAKDYNIEEKDQSYSRMIYLLKRIDESPESGYADFQYSEKEICNQPIKYMSVITDRLLRSIDYDYIKKVRRENFMLLEQRLESSNELSFVLSPDSVPLAYPYLTYDTSLRAKMLKERIYIPTYWPNVSEWAGSNSYESLLASTLLPLPIGQTYNASDINRIINLISN